MPGASKVGNGPTELPSLFPPLALWPAVEQNLVPIHEELVLRIRHILVVVHVELRGTLVLVTFYRRFRRNVCSLSFCHCARTFLLVLESQSELELALCFFIQDNFKWIRSPCKE